MLKLHKQGLLLNNYCLTIVLVCEAVWRRGRRQPGTIRLISGEGRGTITLLYSERGTMTRI